MLIWSASVNVGGSCLVRSSKVGADRCIVLTQELDAALQAELALDIDRGRYWVRKLEECSL